MNINFFQGKKFSEQKFRGLVFTKTLMKVVMTVLVMVLSFSALLPFAHAEYDHMDKRKKCTMTIESDKHTFDNPAISTGVCKDYVWGYYVSDDVGEQFNIIGSVTGSVEYSGQQFEVPHPHSDYNPILTVHIIKKDPPPKPSNPKPEQNVKENEKKPKESSVSKETPSKQTNSSKQKTENRSSSKPSTKSEQNSKKSVSMVEKTKNQTVTQSKDSSKTIKNKNQTVTQSKDSSNIEKSNGQTKEIAREKHENTGNDSNDNSAKQEPQELSSSNNKKKLDNKELLNNDNIKSENNGLEQKSFSAVIIFIIITATIISIAGWFLWKRRVKNNESKLEEN